MKRRDTGILGEKLAGQYLEEKGYRILQRNYRCREGEIDIIAEHEGSLVFVEVRCRHSDEHGSPEESVVPAKMEKLRVCAARYLQEREALPLSWRIDVIAIGLDRSSRFRYIHHIENAIEDN